MTKKNNILAVLMTIAVFCMGQIPGSIDAAISKITIAFDLSSTSGLYVTTVACLVSVAFSILLGFIAGKKIGFKPLIFFCATVELIASLLPFLADNFIVLIILRGLFGIGFGGMQSMENTIATTLITPQKRAQILGIGMFFGFGMNCLLQFIGGILADLGWNYVFLNHLLLIIPYILICIGCLKLDLTAAPQENNEQKQTKLSVSVFQIWLLILLIGVFIAPLLVGCSFLSEQIDDSATIAGIVAVCFSIGCMIGGLCYSKIFDLMKKNALPLFLCIMSIGIAGSAYSRTIIGLCIMIFIAGMGFAMSQSMCMMILNLSVDVSQIAFVSAIMMALFNLGMFLSSSYEALIEQITNDALYLPLYIGAIILIIFAIIYKIHDPLSK